MNMISALTTARKSLPVLSGIFLMWGATAHAAPLALSTAQLDSVAAAGVETVDGFVCPVIKTDNVLHSPKSGTLGGGEYYTIGGPNVSVPMHATNDNGAGSPAGPFATPGDTSYTAVWGLRP